METIWNNTGGFVDGMYTVLLCYYVDDMEEYRRLCGLEVLISYAVLMWR